MGYWNTFNKWYRDFWEAEGVRPNANDIKFWFDSNADAVWGDTKPTWEEARVHSKCLRSLDQVRNYFRQYRAQKKGDSVDSQITGKRSEMSHSAGGGSYSQGTMSQSEMSFGDMDGPYMPPPKARRPSVESGDTAGCSFLSLGSTDIAASNNNSPAATSKLSGRGSMMHESGYPLSRSATPPHLHPGAPTTRASTLAHGFQPPPGVPLPLGPANGPSRLSISSSGPTNTAFGPSSAKPSPTSAPPAVGGACGTTSMTRTSSLTLVFGGAPGQPPLLNPANSNPLPGGAPWGGPNGAHQRVRINVSRQLPPLPPGGLQQQQQQASCGGQLVVGTMGGGDPQGRHPSGLLPSMPPSDGHPMQSSFHHHHAPPPAHMHGGHTAPAPYLSSFASAPLPYGYERPQHMLAPQYSMSTQYGAAPGPCPPYGPGTFYHGVPPQGQDGLPAPSTYTPFMEPCPSGPYSMGYHPAPGAVPPAPTPAPSAANPYPSMYDDGPSRSYGCIQSKPTADVCEDARYPMLAPPVQWNRVPLPAAAEPAETAAAAVAAADPADDDFGMFMEALLGGGQGDLFCDGPTPGKVAAAAITLNGQPGTAAPAMTSPLGVAVKEEAALTPSLAASFLCTPRAAAPAPPVQPKCEPLEQQQFAAQVKVEPGLVLALANDTGLCCDQSIAGDLQACIADMRHVAVAEPADAAAAQRAACIKPIGSPWSSPRPNIIGTSGGCLGLPPMAGLQHITTSKREQPTGAAAAGGTCLGDVDITCDVQVNVPGSASGKLAALMQMDITPLLGTRKGSSLFGSDRISLSGLPDLSLGCGLDGGVGGLEDWMLFNSPKMPPALE